MNNYCIIKNKNQESLKTLDKKMYQREVAALGIWIIINFLLLWGVFNLEIPDSPLAPILFKALFPLCMYTTFGAIFSTILIILLPLLKLIREIK